MLSYHPSRARALPCVRNVATEDIKDPEGLASVILSTGGNPEIAKLSDLLFCLLMGKVEGQAVALAWETLDSAPNSVELLVVSQINKSPWVAFSTLKRNDYIYLSVLL